MSEVKIVGRGVDTLMLNVCYTDKQFQPIKQELNADLQELLSILQDEAYSCGYVFLRASSNLWPFWIKP